MAAASRTRSAAPSPPVTKPVMIRLPCLISVRALCCVSIIMFSIICCALNLATIDVVGSDGGHSDGCHRQAAQGGAPWWQISSATGRRDHDAPTRPFASFDAASICRPSRQQVRAAPLSPVGHRLVPDPGNDLGCGRYALAGHAPAFSGIAHWARLLA